MNCNLVSEKCKELKGIPSILAMLKFRILGCGKSFPPPILISLIGNRGVRRIDTQTN